MHSSHPIAKSIVDRLTQSGIKLDSTSIAEHVDFPGRGVQAQIRGHEILVGSDGLLHHKQIAHDVANWRAPPPTSLSMGPMPVIFSSAMH